MVNSSMSQASPMTGTALPFYKSGEIINVADSIIRLTEAFELAARLSLTEAGSLFMRIEITHANLASRCLDFNGVREQYAVRGCQSKKNVFSFDKEISQIELITEAKELALEPAAQLFRQFGWEPHRQPSPRHTILADWPKGC